MIGELVVLKKCIKSSWVAEHLHSGFSSSNVPEDWTQGKHILSFIEIRG